MMLSRHDIRVFANTARGFEYPPATDEQLAAVGYVPLQQVVELKSLLRRALADFWEDDSSWIHEAHMVLGDVRLTRYERALTAAAVASKVAAERLQERNELLAFVQRNYRRIFDALHGEGYGGQRTLPGQLSLASDMKRLLEWRAAELPPTPDKQDSSDRAQVTEDQTPLPVESAAADPARSGGPDAQGSTGSGGEVDEWAKRAAGFITDGPDKLTPEQISAMVEPGPAAYSHGIHEATVPLEERAGYIEGRLTSLLKMCREQCGSAERAKGEPYRSHFTILAIENLARAVEMLATRKEPTK